MAPRGERLLLPLFGKVEKVTEERESRRTRREGKRAPCLTLLCVDNGHRKRRGGQTKDLEGVKVFHRTRGWSQSRNQCGRGEGSKRNLIEMKTRTKKVGGKLVKDSRGTCLPFTAALV
jgi:hypothetical protein